jgi:Flp pilus assembly protein TadD
MRVLLLCVGLLGAFTAVAGPDRRRPAFREDDLLDPAVVGLAATEPALTRDQIFGMDDEMRAFVAEVGANRRDTQAALQRLLAAMQARGLFTLTYDDDFTRTASGTFHDGRGNCLSFTILFVALAREAGLDVSYQLVDVPPTWSWSEDLVVYGNHINALITRPFGNDYVVDFNLRDVKSQYTTSVVDDAYVLSLFYSNRGAEALTRKEYAESFGYLKAAVAASPEHAGPWVNLGVLFGRLGREDEAEAAYTRALAIDRENPSALSNLSNLYARIGDREAADRYRERIRRYLQINPYYHYTLARKSFEQGELDSALSSVRHALRIKDDEYRFYELEGLVYRKLGKPGSAAKSFERAGEVVESAELKERFLALADEQVTR